MISSEGSLNFRDSSLVIECESDLGKYLRNLFWLASYKTKRLGAPERGNHVTIVSKSESKPFLSILNGERVEFSILLDPYTNGNAYWLPVCCSLAKTIRSSLGLPPPVIPFHFGVGYLEIGKVYGTSKYLE